MQVESFGTPTWFEDVREGALFVDLRNDGSSVFGLAVSIGGFRGAIYFEATGPSYVAGLHGLVHVINNAVLQCDPSSAVAPSTSPNGSIIRTADDAFVHALDSKQDKVTSYSLATGLYASVVDVTQAIAFTKWEIVTLQANNSYKSLFAFDASKCATVPPQ